MRIEPYPPRRRRSFLTPMIDVVFLLLLYFMLVSHYQNLCGIPLDATAIRQSGASENVVLVTIQEDGAVSLNGVRVDQAELEQQLRSALHDNPHLRVGVHPASAVPLQQLVQVMDQVRATGVSRLTLAQE
jgi:biopolymer transport protein ExbD